MLERDQVSNQNTSVSEKILTNKDLIQAIRLNIAAEHKAIHRYLVQVETVDHALAKAVLVDIANEKRVHLSELERLLDMLTGEGHKPVAEGRERVDELAAELTESAEETRVASLEDAWKQATESLDRLGI
jgi:rubrerythrin